jgi:hypothetical protein
MFSLLAANGAISLSRRQLHRLGFAGMASSNRLHPRRWPAGGSGERLAGRPF